MKVDLIKALKDIEKDRNIPLEVLITGIEESLVSAYKKHFDSEQNVIVIIDRESGETEVWAIKKVVKRVRQPLYEVNLKEALKIEPDIEAGQEIKIKITPSDFGRIAAQTAKQVIVQRFREAERDIIISEFEGRQGEIIGGVVHRKEGRNIFVDLGKIEAVLPPQEQVARENFKHGERVKIYLLEIKKLIRGPQLIASRAHPELVKKLFEMEVPEIEHGIVSIRNIARDAGYRSKIAVKSSDSNVDPVGACVGAKGSRVQNVVDELRGEKIDIIEYSDDPYIFIANSLSPARVISITLYEESGNAHVIVPDDKLSLAIGKDGQNARLAAKLTGWKIDIKSESQYKEKEARENLDQAKEGVSE